MADCALHQIQASAGSGKTHELTRRFLNYLRTASEQFPSALPARGKHGWTDILAVTFTNRAATEMQKRIIDRLKATALNLEQREEDWTPEQARHWLTTLLRHYGALNIRTIDSLLYLIVRLNALEFGLPPDFDTAFDSKEALSPLLDDVLEETRENPELADILDRVCQDVFFHDMKRGFSLRNSLRDKVLELCLHFLNSETNVANTQAILHEMTESLDAFRQLATILLSFVELEQLSIHANFRKALHNCTDCPDEAIPPDSVFIQKSSLDECLNKASKGLASDESTRAYAQLASLGSQIKLLRLALRYAPYVELARVTATRIPTYIKQQGIVPAERIPHLASLALSGAYGISEPLCRLGSGLNHILIDEFQDTSREQWHAIQPLVVDALSRGGSLTWVGDVKQAIYGWRGGDVALFNTIGQDPALLRLAPAPERASLETNRRSSSVVVETNNALFDIFSAETPETKGLVQKFITTLLPEKIDKTLLASIEAEGISLLQASFSRATQKVFEKKKDSGFFQLRRIEGETSEALLDNTQRALLETVQELGMRRPYSDLAILVRTNKQASQIAGWLLSRNIPVVTDNSFLLAEHPIIIQITALLSFLDEPDDDRAFWTALSGQELFQPLFDLPRQTLLEWLACKRQPKGKKRPLYLLFKEDFPELWERWFEPLYGKAGLSTPYDLSREVLSRLSILQRFPSEHVFTSRFLEILHCAEEKGYRSLTAFLTYWKKQGQAEKAPMPESLKAVRVITIHKAKGLEFPVVIIPQHDFYTPRRASVQKRQVGPLAVLIPLTKEANGDYYTAKLEDIREALQLLYVAWTRPSEELYAFLPALKCKKVNAFIKGLNLLLPETTTSRGTPSGNGAEPQTEEPKKAISLPLPERTPAGGCKTETDQIYPRELCRPMPWLPALRIFRNPLEQFSFSKNGRGLLVHHCLSFLQIDRDPAQSLTKARQAAIQGLLTFPLPVQDPKKIEDELTSILHWYASLPEAFCWTHAGTPEQELIDEQGKRHRADLVVQQADGATVIEYKTGQPSPNYEKQVQRYMSLLAQATGQAVEGVLVYLDQQIIQRFPAITPQRINNSA